MAEINTFKTIPVGSLLILPEGEDQLYLDKIGTLPPAIKQLVTQPRTGAYIRGLAKNFDIPLESAPVIAFAVLRVALGEITLDQLAATLASELHVDAPKAQAVAQDIAKELFTPMAKAQPPETPPAGNIPNLLDLKNLPRN